MSFSIKWGDEAPENAGFIYFDAVTSWNQNYTGQVTSHPIDGGGNISDHFIRSNPTFTLSGVISSVDVSLNSWLFVTDTEVPSNIRVPVLPVTVTSTDSSVLSRFLPDTIGQFLPDSTPEVIMDERDDGRTIVEAVKDALVRLIYSGKKYNETTKQFDNVVQTVTIYEYDGAGQNIVRKLPEFPTEKIVVTSVVFREDVNTGMGLYCDISFEQVEFVALQKVDIPKRPAPAVKKKTAAKKSGGKCDSSVKSTGDANNTDSAGKKTSIDNTASDVDPRRSIGQ